MVCNEAAVFAHTNGKLFLYRNKDGDWVVGKYLTEILKSSSSPVKAELLETTRREFT